VEITYMTEEAESLTCYVLCSVFGLLHFQWKCALC